MQQFVAVILAFLLLPLLISKLKSNLALSLGICGLVIHVLALRSWESLYKAVLNIFTFSSVNVILTVFLIGILSSLMKHYRLLEDIVSSMKNLFLSSRLLVGLIPFIIGILSVPGGAYLSVPFVDNLGKEMDIAPEKRAAINLSFRHIGMFVIPFSTLLLYVAANVPEINIYYLIMLNLAFVLVIQIGATILYIPRHCPPVFESGKAAPKKESFKKLIFSISPIVIAVLFNGLLKLPMYAAIALSIAWIWVISPKNEFMSTVKKGCSFDVPLMLLGVYFIQNTILQLTDIMNAFISIFQSPSTFVILMAVAVGCIFIGTVTGLSLANLGVFIPMIHSLPLSPTQLLLYIFFLCIWSFLGYYYSPLHLCQILTIKYIGISTKDVYKQHLRLFPWLAAASFGLYFLYSQLLL